MKRLTASDMKDMNLLKHYRIIRRWASRNNDLNDADLELLIYLDCIDLFSIKDFKMGSYSYSWDNRRWNRLIQNEWIKVWRHHNRTTQKYNIYKVSFKGKTLIIIEQLKNTIYIKFLLKVKLLFKECIV